MINPTINSVINSAQLSDQSFIAFVVRSVPLCTCTVSVKLTIITPMYDADVILETHTILAHIANHRLRGVGKSTRREVGRICNPLTSNANPNSRS